jgi:hypothetical protein
MAGHQLASQYLSTIFRQITALRVLVLAVVLATTSAHSKVPADIWFAQAGATGDGKSLANPIGSSDMLEHSSGAGDTIFLVPSDSAFDGGLTLKLGQSLIGLTKDGRKPVITNSDSTRNGGCGIVLANSSRISNVQIEDTFASGIYAVGASDIHIDGVDVLGANRSESFIEAKYPTLPGALPHGGMVFVHSKSPADVQISSSAVVQAAGFGIVSITSDSANSRLSVSHTRVEGGSKIGFFDAGISALVQGSEASAHLNISDSQAWGRLSRSGRNVMVVASAGAHADTRVERFFSGPVGQDGIVMAVMQSPSKINLYIGDSLIEGAGQMNVEGSLINLPADDPTMDNQGMVSIEIEASTIRNAGAVSGFEDVAANIWLGGSQFLEERLPAVGTYKLRINDSRIEAAGRSGLELGDLSLLQKGQPEKSKYDVVLRGNTIVNNGEADVMIYAPGARIDARGNCWGRPEGLAEHRVKSVSPARVSQMDATEPVSCTESPSEANH